jgi:hypothetical protein
MKGVALGIGQADYGVDSVALMGVSAARMHGAIPAAWPLLFLRCRNNALRCGPETPE